MTPPAGKTGFTLWVVAAAFWVPLALAAAPDVAAAVPLALAVLEAVPLADVESDFESDPVVLDAASDDLVGEALEDVEDVSACNLSPQSCCSS